MAPFFYVSRPDLRYPAGLLHRRDHRNKARRLCETEMQSRSWGVKSPWAGPVPWFEVQAPGSFAQKPNARRALAMPALLRHRRDCP